MKLVTIKPQFVELMPREIQDGVLYISEKYNTAIHNCCCGCGMKVVTPLSPARWRLNREGNLVTLRPSIGNWDFPCRSHYWIRRNHVEWAGSMTDKEIRQVKEQDKRDIERHIVKKNNHKAINIATKTKSTDSSEYQTFTWLSKLWSWLKSL